MNPIDRSDTIDAVAIGIMMTKQFALLGGQSTESLGEGFVEGATEARPHVMKLGIGRRTSEQGQRALVAMFVAPNAAQFHEGHPSGDHAKPASEISATGVVHDAGRTAGARREELHAKGLAKASSDEVPLADTTSQDEADVTQECILKMDDGGGKHRGAQPQAR